MNNLILYLLLACLAAPLFFTLMALIFSLTGNEEKLDSLPNVSRIREQYRVFSRLRDSAANPWKKDQDQYQELASLVDELHVGDEDD